MVNLAMRRVRRKMVARHRQARGISASLLSEIIDLQPDDLLGLRNRALLHIRYDILARRSELTALNIKNLEFFG